MIYGSYTMTNQKNDRITFENGYFMAPNDIFDLELKLHEKIVYLYLCRCGNNSTAFPSYNTIAKKCSISRRKAIDVVASLKESGLLKKKIRKKDDFENMSNIYEVVPPSAYRAPGSAYGSSGGVEYAPYKELDYKEHSYEEKQGLKRDLRLCDFQSFKERHTLRSDIIECIEYYMSLYWDYRGTKHPDLKGEQWVNVAENLFYCDGLEFSDTDMFAMMEKHFKTKYKDCDYNILHFMSGKIRELRMYEEAYY